MRMERSVGLPHSTIACVCPAVERISRSVLPPAVHHLICSQSEDCLVLRLFLRALFGLVSGAVFYLGIAQSLPLTFDLKLTSGCVFVAVCILCGMFSSFFRSSILLTFPSMLGSRGRTYVLLLILSVLFKGPITNIQANVQEAALSVSCNLDLQLEHSRTLWRETLQPFITIMEDIMDTKGEFQQEAKEVNTKFQSITEDMMSQYGYDNVQWDRGGDNTQERYVSKTMMQCDNIVEAGVQRCRGWFNEKWLDCLDTIKLPVFSYLLCLPMKFDLLCQILKVMAPWCQEEVPVEDNFGQLFDKVNVSVDFLTREFTTELHVEDSEQQSVLHDGPLLGIKDAVSESLSSLTGGMQQLLELLQMLLSLTFITFFTGAFGYIRQYRTDVHFDNVYLTTYFRQIDHRRRQMRKRRLLPPSVSEMKKLIDPWSLKIHKDEFRAVCAGLVYFLSISLLCFFLLAVDFAVFHILDIVSRHTAYQLNITSKQHVDIRVGGVSIMSNLLRKTLEAFNSSASINIQSHNQGVYVSCLSLLLLVALLCCLQVYTNRLRRVIAAFFHRKREKKRVLFLYNLLLQQQVSSLGRKSSVSAGCRFCQGRRGCSVLCCCRCGEQQANEKEPTYDPG
ncbi:E3 ubiquitin-protein ligase DCST1 [Genypterus blacodes]|uniref:E3 ubiquitin-protein ligase DCST1 n=1 Tax=Genypterus blacodes TaxID=154954 RepID=UPI003F75E0CA